MCNENELKRQYSSLLTGCVLPSVLLCKYKHCSVFLRAVVHAVLSLESVQSICVLHGSGIRVCLQWVPLSLWHFDLNSGRVT